MDLNIILTGASNKEKRQQYEILGDSLLGFLFVDYITKKFPNYGRKEITILKNRNLNNNKLGLIYQNIINTKYNSNSKSDGSMLETMIGYIYTECGYEDTLNWFNEMIVEELSLEVVLNYKSQLQEYTQKKFQKMPTYRLIRQFGQSPNEIFEYEVIFNGKILARAQGSSKKDASMKCAQLALNDILGG